DGVGRRCPTGIEILLAAVVTLRRLHLRARGLRLARRRPRLRLHHRLFRRALLLRRRCFFLRAALGLRGARFLRRFAACFHRDFLFRFALLLRLRLGALLGLWLGHDAAL